MGQVLHGCATTTEAVRRAIQNSQESLRALANRYGINQKTVRKWRNRSSATDLPTGPKKPSTVLSVEEEAVVVAFRRHALLPLDDCLYAPSTPSSAEGVANGSNRPYAEVSIASRHFQRASAPSICTERSATLSDASAKMEGRRRPTTRIRHSSPGPSRQR